MFRWFPILRFIYFFVFIMHKFLMKFLDFPVSSSSGLQSFLILSRASLTVLSEDEPWNPHDMIETRHSESIKSRKVASDDTSPDRRTDLTWRESWICPNGSNICRTVDVWPRVLGGGTAAPLSGRPTSLGSVPAPSCPLCRWAWKTVKDKFPKGKKPMIIINQGWCWALEEETEM